ncbi:TIGR01777 family oxidoreductase [uncultured Flavobacterium sp.]|uniref:TIGR01777 family oxidoreductase n=1 Tax=uncultured Flavobacterium sp. TaxID=165435 RepID=UPI0030EBDFD4|tara:strand:- start:132328 stop:133233 length:906 start_codon:yes stop_codon:yes gene_type:complete
MKVLITGATGMIGQELVKVLHQNNVKVNYLSTSKDKLVSRENYKGFYWNPDTNEIDITAFDGVSVVYHLAGATVAKRWTSSYKKEILDSRTIPTRLLFSTLEKNPNKVTQIISASAIGIYPNSLGAIYNEENTGVDDSFLGEVVQKWENEVDAFKKLNILVTKIRIGIVLSNKGGALPQMVNPIKYGVGAAFGSGKQYQSWIHVEDLVNIFYYTQVSELDGIYNAVAPHPVTNSVMTKEIAKVIKRPLWLPNIPKFVMKMILGEMYILVFSSQSVSALKILNQGYQFKYATLEKALANLLK